MQPANTTLHRFGAFKHGINVLAGVTSDSAGNFDAKGDLYGTTEAGGSNGYGTVFELTPTSDGSWTENVLHQFTGGQDGGNPFAGLIFDTAGNLYSTAIQGGYLSCNPNIGCGTVFKLSPNSHGGWNQTVLHQFVCQPGCFPRAGVFLNPAGNLLGTTQGDGAGLNGSVFAIRQ